MILRHSESCTELCPAAAWLTGPSRSYFDSVERLGDRGYLPTDQVRLRTATENLRNQILSPLALRCVDLPTGRSYSPPWRRTSFGHVSGRQESPRRLSSLAGSLRSGSSTSVDSEVRGRSGESGSGRTLPAQNVQTDRHFTGSIALRTFSALFLSSLSLSTIRVSCSGIDYRTAGLAPDL